MYAMSWERNNNDAKYESIQDGYEVEEYEEETEEDFFGFSKAIEIDHLTDEELEMIGDMF